MLLPEKMPKKIKPIVYMTVCVAHGFLFGTSGYCLAKCRVEKALAVQKNTGFTHIIVTATRSRLEKCAVVHRN